MITPRKIAEEYQILRVTTGSQLYGTSLAENSDRDEIGICIPPPTHIIGGKMFTQFGDRTAKKGERSTSGDLDLTIFGLRKWMELAQRGNPNILEVLFSPSERAILMTSYGFDLRKRPELIVSRAAGERFLGFMSSQRGKLMGTGRAHTNRPELIEKFGYDTKAAYHAVRMGLEGHELMETGTLSFPIHERGLELLLGIRRGEYTLKEVLELIDGLDARLKRAIEISQLPDKPNFEKIDQWMVNTHIQYWREHSLI